MRTYSELSTKEKDKFKTYQIIKEAWSLQQIIVLVIVYVGIFIGVPLLMIPSYALNVAGALVLTLSAALLVAVIYVMRRDKKYLYLAFDIERPFVDVFEIKEEDMKNLKLGFRRKEV